MSGVVLLTWAGLWLWGGVASYGAAGVGGALLWLALGSLACLFGFIWSFEWLVERLDETLSAVFGLALLLGFVWLVQYFWAVRV